MRFLGGGLVSGAKLSVTSELKEAPLHEVNMLQDSSKSAQQELTTCGLDTLLPVDGSLNTSSLG